MKTIGYVAVGIGYCLLGFVAVPLLVVGMPIVGLFIAFYMLGKETVDAVKQFGKSEGSPITKSL